MPQLPAGTTLEVKYLHCIPAAEIMEKWLPIPNFEDLYQVSDCGRVKSNARVETTAAGWSRSRNERLLKSFKDHGGQLYVDLCRNYCKTRWYIHRLVLTVFVSKCPEGMEGCHNDGNLLNNTLPNLRWDTHISNIHDKDRHQTTLKGETHYASKLKAIDILKIRNLASQGVVHHSIAQDYGVCREAITRIVNRKNWKHI